MTTGTGPAARPNVAVTSVTRTPRWETLRALRTVAGMAFRADPRAALVVAALFPFEFTSGALQALALKGLTDAAAARPLARARP